MAVLGNDAAAYAAKRWIWVPANSVPTMSLSSSPVTQDVTKTSTIYTITATLTDKDTYSRSDTGATSIHTGNMNEVECVRGVKPLPPGPANVSFDSDTGKRIYTWVVNGPFGLVDSGQMLIYSYDIGGRDNATMLAIKDADVPAQRVQVRFMYKPVLDPGPPPPGGGE